VAIAVVDEQGVCPVALVRLGLAGVVTRGSGALQLEVLPEQLDGTAVEAGVADEDRRVFRRLD
jgi:hypothetical protein